ncbi:hypothetical protein PtB15_10B470 [Puccinia triticina]|nr:hypothetical protein PtB15_10B470 [Puccinia triticina]
MKLNLDNLDFSLLKVLTILHLGNVNLLIYPVEIVAALADRTSALKWSYKILEPDEFDKDTITLANDTFCLFVDAVHKLSQDATVLLVLTMAKENLAIVMVIDSPRETASSAVVSLKFDKPQHTQRFNPQRSRSGNI